MSITRTWYQSWPWILAGVVSGMAILTRATGLILLGVVGLVLILRVGTELQQQTSLTRTLRSAILDGSIWLLSTGATIFLLLPALWVQPAQTLEKLWSWSSNAATEGHENPTFFRGIHHDDPGVAVYPAVLIWRTSPPEWLGIVLLIVLGWWGWRKRKVISANGLRSIFVMVVFAFTYVAAMSVGAKKFDRYILPVFPIIAVLAAQGFALGMKWIEERGGRTWKRIAYATLALALVSQILSWNSVRPYRLDYYNPMLGGADRAQNTLQMGWGQGGDQVVEFLEERAGDDEITVQTSAVPSAFTYFLADDSPIRFRNFGLGTPAGWYETHYYVSGIQQTQRGLDPWYDSLKPYEATQVVEIGGVPYFEIYHVRNLQLPESLRGITACNYSFGDQITLMQIIGRDNSIDFYFLSEDESMTQALELDINITMPDGAETKEVVNLTPAPVGHVSRVTIPYAQLDTPLSDATISISASSESHPMSVSAPWTDDLTAEAVTQSECYYSEPPG